MNSRLNDLEELVEEGAHDFVDLVYELVEELAPVRPWWSAELSADQKLWRWMTGPRDEIMAWLMQAGVHMGWQSAPEVLAHIEDIFESPAAPDIIPPNVIAQIPFELLEMVQAAGAKDTGVHIRRMEKMFEGRRAALALLAATDQPDVPDTPPPTPVSLIPGEGTGWPYFGGVPGAGEMSPPTSLPNYAG